ncbi:MAG: restriction endonuclease subunit S [Pseudomonadota bacterium]
MKAGWNREKLGDVCDLLNRGISPKYLEKCGIRVLNQKCIRNHQVNYEQSRRHDDATKTVNENRLIKLGDVLVNSTGTGTLGRVAQVREDTTEPTTVDSHVTIVRPKHEKFFPNFFGYMLIDIEEHIKESGEGCGGQTELARSVLAEKFFVSYPNSIAEQKRIVAILDQAFESIAIAKANAEQNLKNARELFESHLQSVFMRGGKNWKMERLDALTHLSRGHNPPKSKFSTEYKLGYVRFYQIRDGSSDDYTVYVPDTPQLHKMKKDDIMMVAYRHVGRVFRGVEGAFNVALCKISNVRRDLLDDDYLFHVMPSSFVKGELLKRSERSLIPSMSIEHLKELKIPLPPIKDQIGIVNLFNFLQTQTQNLESIYQQKIAALNELKKSLLHKAFNGEL